MVDPYPKPPANSLVNRTEKLDPKVEAFLMMVLDELEAYAHEDKYFMENSVIGGDETLKALARRLMKIKETLISGLSPAFSHEKIKSEIKLKIKNIRRGGGVKERMENLLDTVFSEAFKVQGVPNKQTEERRLTPVEILVNSVINDAMLHGVEGALKSHMSAIKVLAREMGFVAGGSSSYFRGRSGLNFVEQFMKIAMGELDAKMKQVPLGTRLVKEELISKMREVLIKSFT